MERVTIGDAVSQPSIREIIHIASAVWDVPVKDITGKSRFHKHVKPRFAVYEAARRSGKTLTQIARAVGNRDWTTVRDGLGRAENYARFDPEYSRKLTEFNTALEVKSPIAAQSREIQSSNAS